MSTTEETILHALKPLPEDEREARAEQEFREQCRRQMARPVEDRMRFGFYRMRRPVLDDLVGARSFASTAEYRAWCAAALPPYLGYQPAPADL